MDQRPSFRKKQIEDDRNHQDHHDCLHAAHDIAEGHMRCRNHDCHGDGCYEIPRPGMHDKKRNDVCKGRNQLHPRIQAVNQGFRLIILSNGNFLKHGQSPPSFSAKHRDTRPGNSSRSGHSAVQCGKGSLPFPPAPSAHSYSPEAQAPSDTA